MDRMALGTTPARPARCLRALAASGTLLLALQLGLAQDARASDCAGDVDHDGAVGAADLAAMLSGWGAPNGSNSAGDLNGDSVVDAGDLAIVLGNWGSCVVVPEWADLLEARPDPEVVTDPELRAAIVATGLAWRVRDAASGIEMLLVPPGAMRMGASPGDALAFDDEFPAHHVVLSQPYYLGRHETTQGEFLAATGYNPSFFTGSSDGDAAMHPVEMVSYPMVLEFLEATGLRLPTEAEWEFACRGGTFTPIYARAGETAEDIAWHAPNSGFVTNPVGTRAPNALGLHDMLGNVWEWVADWYSGGYYEVSPQFDPPGPADGSFKIIRGGSWFVSASNLRSSFRGAYWPGGQLGDTGFRVARDAP